MRVPGKALSLALGAGTLLISGALQAETRIVTSIKPVELIVSAIATDDMQTTTLVPPGSSPHNYTMKPSQRRALENADVIFWVGPDMETFLNRLLAGQEFSGRTVALMDAEDEPAEVTHGEHAHDAHDDHADDHHGHAHKEEAKEEERHNEGHGHGHDHGDGEDPHIWLDPELAIEMAGTVRDALSRLEGVDAGALNENFELFKASVRETDANIRDRLAPAHDISLFAYHDAFTRFAEHYELKLEGVLTLNPELSPGARHIAEVQEKLRNANHPCLLTEPQFNRQWWRSITENLNVTFSTWDPLATDIEATAQGYNNFQHSIVDAVLNCLPEDTEH
ncbi:MULTISPECIES: zinc ABC transporter substrate-binding protein [Marinobacter]|uniref:zinc ABC transporter substrate-binding protein n=1 Tax=Marinobacter TaxID=2742 RepID=UPI001B06D075|nr:zinc ABC transporter substrate-binding protein [Marinobacter sp.]MBO6811154.1 zinc ABC transporter substrate-binding protein [Marinobacter sp.]MBO6874575.1 zinc ABC transporter substrate-binding protein [Marinobacter sp.]